MKRRKSKLVLTGIRTPATLAQHGKVTAAAQGLMEATKGMAAFGLENLQVEQLEGLVKATTILLAQKQRLSPADQKWCKVTKYDAQQELERR